MISAFPYTEGFEAGPAWTSGGTDNDWAWGAPAHPLINAAGGGVNAWCVGGLTGTFYNDGQQSWLESPCFDLSALQYPWVSFKIFWECERTYDGMAFQYSLDEGSTWSNVGGVGAGQPTNCLNTNWYNTANINNLFLANPKVGWSGRVDPTQGNCTGGQGSGEWVTASQCLQDLAGEPSVKFRFVFGAGTTCNSYDGIAVDDIFIGEAPANEATFTYTCSGNTITFQDVSPWCPTSRIWDFGDPASGAANNSSLQTAAHTFPGPGTYDVSLTVGGPCNAPSTLTIPVSILGLEFETVDPGCAGNNGSIIALVSGTSVPLNVLWTPGGATTAMLTGLSAGTYNVDVSAPGACPVSGSTTLVQQGSAPELAVSVSPAGCAGEASGEALVTVSGGVAPYAFSWAPAGGNAAQASGLAAGTYICTVTDLESCVSTINVVITEPAPLVLTAGADATACAGSEVTMQATAVGGTAPYTFFWSPSGPVVTALVDGTYTVGVTDANGCTAADAAVELTVVEVAPPQFTVDDPSGCTPHCVVFTEQTSGPGERLWAMGDGTVLTDAGPISHCYLGGGLFDVTLTVTTDEGCSSSTTLEDAVEATLTPVASFNAVPMIATIDDPLIQFVNTSTGGTDWHWSFGDPLESDTTGFNAAFSYAETGCYTVELVVSGSGCTASGQATVCVEDEFALYAPNAFTPNGDGINDVFNVVTTVNGPELFELIIFDRWGQQIFTTDKATSGWLADAVPIGVYIWQVRIKDRTGRLQERSGHVTLLR